jgi:hypothetical protein
MIVPFLARYANLRRFPFAINAKLGLPGNSVRPARGIKASRGRAQSSFAAEKRQGRLAAFD